jgi:Family of unknown function (DUF6445)
MRPPDTLNFNPEPRIEHVRFSSGISCVIVDDALLNPEQIVQLAAERSEQFRNVDFNAYPGIYLLTPTFEAGLVQFFNRHIRRVFDSRRVVRMHCRLSMVTLAPHALRPYQRMCHRDMAALDARHSIQASILYLFKDPGLGGTSFYEPARPAEEIAALFTDASTLPVDAFDSKYPAQTGYMCGSNHYFNCVGTVPAQWNRGIFYDGYVLHSGDILAAERLSDDPLAGRLTLNAFFSSRRNVARPA